MWRLKPRSQRTRRITKIVQSILDLFELGGCQERGKTPGTLGIYVARLFRSDGLSLGAANRVEEGSG